MAFSSLIAMIYTHSATVSLVTGLQAALWGLLGSGVAEALNLSASMRPVGPRRKWRWPWHSRADRPVMLVAVALRLFAGLGLAAALGAAGYLTDETAALMAGVATPLVVARLFQAIPLYDAPPAADPAVPAARESAESGRSSAAL